MKCLVITDAYPVPEIGGHRIRTMNFVRFFSQYGDVDIAHYNDVSYSEGTSAYFPFQNAIHIDINRKEAGVGKYQEYYEKLKYAKPWKVCNYSRSETRKLTNIIEHGGYDYILCRYAINAYPLFLLSDKKKQNVIIDIDDLISSDLYQVVNGTHRGINYCKAWMDMKMQQWHQIRCAKIGKALVCSEHDRNILVSRTKSETVYVVPNIAPDFRLSNDYLHDGYGNIDTFLFVGSLQYQPNVQGLNWFIEEIFNRMIRKGAKLKLLIAGRNPDAQLRSLCNDHVSIELIENPPDLTPYYESCGLVIVPLLAGGGTRIKILEAGRALRPVISTRIGAYGLDLGDRRDFLLMSDYESFQDSYNWLKVNSNYKFLTDNMSKYVEDNFTSANFAKAMSAVISC